MAAPGEVGCVMADSIHLIGAVATAIDAARMKEVK
jgi:hypothetical protein